MPLKIKIIFKTLVKKVKTKLSKIGNKMDKDVELEYLQICHQLRSCGMVSLRTWERDNACDDTLFVRAGCNGDVIVRCED
jgi:hypothetical protein